MRKVRKFLRGLFLTPITIMFVPHTSRRTIMLKVPSIGLLISGVLCILGAYYVYLVTVQAVQYREAKEELDYYSGQFRELQPTIAALKMAEAELSRVFHFNSRKAILENLRFADSGAIDIEVLKKQLEDTMESVGEIRNYLDRQKDLYLATPMGWPTTGAFVSSDYGQRIHPLTGNLDFHTGIDLSTDMGLPVKATADGIVSFSGWNGANGNVVAIEHGLGFRTLYGHNERNLVKTGQLVKRGDTVALLGSTGNATGPHVHYEIWHNERPVNPAKYLNTEDSDVFEKK